MKLVTGINPKALQLTMLFLRQYNPQAAKLLPGPKEYPLPGAEMNIEVNPETVSEIIHAINQIGEQWLSEKSRDPSERERNYYRQGCIAFLLEEWIAIGEQCKEKLKIQMN
ncbi:MAG: hypothetical protein ACRBCI_07805 [Cellvibrionaceae bacterium]